MKNEKGLSLLEVVICLTLISVTCLGMVGMISKTLFHTGKIHQAEIAMTIAEETLRYWQYCGAYEASHQLNSCHSFDDIVGFSEKKGDYQISVTVSPLDTSDDGSVLVKKVVVTVRWGNQMVSSGEQGKEQEIQLKSAFSRHNLFSGN
ncbi:type IV pilus modification PilV family protein [Vibrio salinus]|uniref:type IV pilus modification PilV family protein n=1 Tax=Vibrio salinus TaxID=2899784 RepID=UPI001E38DE8A|nr:prepilin-type N-terminal cleavage/methylation domain-containing protein [Vibrio salinus]MCE0493086.1 prepilin-type N-terminal cleavage/methylation domain-containing protein [Vibrio salinus]